MTRAPSLEEPCPRRRRHRSRAPRRPGRAGTRTGPPTVGPAPAASGAEGRCRPRGNPGRERGLCLAEVVAVEEGSPERREVDEDDDRKDEDRDQPRLSGRSGQRPAPAQPARPGRRAVRPRGGRSRPAVSAAQDDRTRRRPRVCSAPVGERDRSRSYPGSAIWSDGPPIHPAVVFDGARLSWRDVPTYATTNTPRLPAVDAATLRRLLLHEAQVHATPGRDLRDPGRRDPAPRPSRPGAVLEPA